MLQHGILSFTASCDRSPPPVPPHAWKKDKSISVPRTDEKAELTQLLQLSSFGRQRAILAFLPKLGYTFNREPESWRTVLSAPGVLFSTC